MLYYVEQKIMDGPSVWGHTLVAKEIIVPKLVDKGKGMEREEKRRKEEGEKKATRNRKDKPQPIRRHEDEGAYKQEIKCQVHRHQ